MASISNVFLHKLIKYINVLNISPNELFDGLFNNSLALDISLENKILELNSNQKLLLLDFIDILTKYDSKKDGN